MARTVMEKGQNLFREEEEEQAEDDRVNLGDFQASCSHEPALMRMRNHSDHVGVHELTWSTLSWVVLFNHQFQIMNLFPTSNGTLSYHDVQFGPGTWCSHWSHHYACFYPICPIPSAMSPFSAFFIFSCESSSRGTNVRSFVREDTLTLTAYKLLCRCRNSVKFSRISVRILHNFWNYLMNLWLFIKLTSLRNIFVTPCTHMYVACLATVDAVFSVKIFQPLVSSSDLHFLLFNVQQHFVLLQFSANVRSEAVLAGLFWNLTLHWKLQPCSLF